MSYETLQSVAREGTKHAHAPYSGYHVGATLLCADGTIFTGCNVENATYGATICAEQVPVCVHCKQGGCKTDFVCHTTELEFVEAIFKCGKLLSAVNARNKTARSLSAEPRNAAKDTPDYFDYIMFNWGNCFAGDSLVTERSLGGADPSEHFCAEKFQPGVRFYFKFEDIVNHKDYVNDGHHCAKIKHELSLVDYLHCCIIPAAHKAALKILCLLAWQTGCFMLRKMAWIFGHGRIKRIDLRRDLRYDK